MRRSAGSQQPRSPGSCNFLRCRYAQVAVTVRVDIPDEIVEHLGLDERTCSRQLLEEFVLRQYASGTLSAGEVGDVLGMGFHDREEFLKSRGAPAGLGLEEHLEGVRNLERALARMSAAVVSTPLR